MKTSFFKKKFVLHLPKIPLFPSRSTKSFVWLYSWLAASTLNMVVTPDAPFVRKHTISKNDWTKGHGFDVSKKGENRTTQ